MKKTYRIKKNKEFQLVFKHGSAVANRQLVLYVLKKPDQPFFRIGLSVSKRIGNAVTRNRVKRLIRESFCHLQETIPPGFDFVVIARKPCADMDYHEMKNSIMHVLRRANAFHSLDKSIHRKGRKL